MLPIGQALTVAMTVGHDARIPGDATLTSEPRAKHSEHLPQEEADQGQDGTEGEGHVQQEVLVGRHLVHSRAQVAGAVVTQDVVDPVHSPAHRVARLVLVDGGQALSLLAVPECGGTPLSSILNLQLLSLKHQII